MARVTVEDCLEEVPNRFALVHLAVKRALQLNRDAEPLIESDNKSCVVALREVAQGKIRFAEDIEDVLTGRIHTEAMRRAQRNS
jgi:DNA-directed RNA polymerase subunit omega